MPKVERQKCSTCPSVYIVFDEDLGETCPRCERNRLREEVATLREQMKVDYWEKVSSENARLHDKILRLESRGIEDMQYEIGQLRRVRDVAVRLVANFDENVCGRGEMDELSDALDAISEEGKLSFTEEIDELEDNFDYGDARVGLEAAFRAGMRFTGDGTESG